MKQDKSNKHNNQFSIKKTILTVIGVLMIVPLIVGLVDLVPGSEKYVIATLASAVGIVPITVLVCMISSDMRNK